MDQPIALQQAFWNEWNAAKAERELSDTSIDQREIIVRWLTRLGRTDLNILEVGCGAGWLCPSLQPFGRVTATDFSEGVLAAASERMPDVRFVAGDFMTLDFGQAKFDVVVTLEMLAHVADQPAFIEKIAGFLRPEGLMMLATQNRPILERHNTIPAPTPGNLRHWVDRDELASLMNPHFEVLELTTLSPVANKGPMRLIAGRQPKRMLRSVFGRSIENALARAGFGWTLITLARKQDRTRGRD